MSGRTGVGTRDPLPRLHVVTDDSVLARRSFVDDAVRVASEGGSTVALHIRGPHASGRSLYDLAVALLPAARRGGAKLILNDRVDVALLVGADGVHLGARSLPLPVARRLLRVGALAGVSVHGADELESYEGADYAFVGSVFETRSHPGARGLGVQGLAAAVVAAGALPVIGIGGVGPADVGGLLAAGAYGVAAVSGVWDQPDPGAAALEYLEALHEVAEPTEGQS